MGPRCVVCRQLPDEGLDVIREFVKKRAAVGSNVGIQPLIDRILAPKYGTTISRSSLERHLKVCDGRTEPYFAG